MSEEKEFEDVELDPVDEESEVAEGEGKRDRFVRLATARTNNAAKVISLIGNLSNSNTYDYTDEDVAKMFAYLEEELAIAKGKFEKPVPRKRFSLSDPLPEED